MKYKIMGGLSSPGYIGHYNFKLFRGINLEVVPNHPLGKQTISWSPIV